MMRDLVIVGARSHARELHDSVMAINFVDPAWNFLGFIEDGGSQHDLIARHGPILGDLDYMRSLDPAKVFYIIGIGAPGDRRRIDDVLSEQGFTAAAVNHPTASIGSHVDVASGCYFAPGAVVTTNVRLGRHVHINTNAVVSHDCTIGDYTVVNPGAHLAGGVVVGEGTYVGMGANVRENIQIGSQSLVGMGAVVVKDVADGVTVAGNPAQTLYKETDSL